MFRKAFLCALDETSVTSTGVGVHVIFLGFSIDNTRGM